MKHTIKFGKLRASNDPDRDVITDGIYYGVSYKRPVATHGSWVRRKG